MIPRSHNYIRWETADQPSLFWVRDDAFAYRYPAWSIDFHAYGINVMAYSVLLVH